MKRDAFGDRMKKYESRETDRSIMPLIPVYARLDGRCFHNFMAGFEKPFDKKFRGIMVSVTKYLIKEFGATVGYTQSDEISLAWYFPEYKSQVSFGGKVHKLTSVVASAATAKFIVELMKEFPHKAEKLPSFDCRVIPMPTLEECSNMFLWREQDAVRNSIQMAAGSVYSHKQMYKKNCSELQEMLFQKGINWNDYAPEFKRGSWVLRRTKLISPEEMLDIPEKHRPTEPVVRKIIEEFPMPIFSTVANRVGVLFNGEEPQRFEEKEDE